MTNIIHDDEEDDALAFFIGLRNALLISIAIFAMLGLIAWQILG